MKGGRTKSPYIRVSRSAKRTKPSAISAKTFHLRRAATRSHARMAGGLAVIGARVDAPKKVAHDRDLAGILNNGDLRAMFDSNTP